MIMMIIRFILLRVRQVHCIPLYTNLIQIASVSCFYLSRTAWYFFVLGIFFSLIQIWDKISTIIKFEIDIIYMNGLDYNPICYDTLMTLYTHFFSLECEEDGKKPSDYIIAGGKALSQHLKSWTQRKDVSLFLLLWVCFYSVTIYTSVVFPPFSLLFVVSLYFRYCSHLFFNS